MTHAHDDVPGPYGSAAQAYLDAGWRGVLPLPLRSKKSPPNGYTGRDGVWPSYPDVYTWLTGHEAGGNIALRLPQHVLGIDVDDYDGKPGGASLTALEAAHGALPPTW